eukprot:889694-Prorocentrum_minimum.AAC.1
MGVDKSGQRLRFQIALDSTVVTGDKVVEQLKLVCKRGEIHPFHDDGLRAAKTEENFCAKWQEFLDESQSAFIFILIFGAFSLPPI